MLFVFVRWSVVFGLWSLVFSLSWFIYLGHARRCRYCGFGLRSASTEIGTPVAVPNTNSPLPIQCPKCQHNGSRLVVRSLTVMSLTCANCGHFWATDVESLPPEIQEKIPDALRDL